MNAGLNDFRELHQIHSYANSVLTCEIHDPADFKFILGQRPVKSHVGPLYIGTGKYNVNLWIEQLCLFLNT